MVEGKTVLDIAASGDRDALALVRDELMTELNAEGSVFRPSDLWAQVEIFARLAACHGYAPDSTVLSIVLLVRAQALQETGHDKLAEALSVEAYTLMDSVIQSGDLDAIALLVATADNRDDDGDLSAVPFVEAILARLTKDQVAAVSARVRTAKEYA